MATVLDALEIAHAQIHPGTPAVRPNFLLRLLHATIDARQRSADRELAEILARRGGIMTEELERSVPGGGRRTYPFRRLSAVRPR